MISLPAWEDVVRCPLNTGDLIRGLGRLEVLMRAEKKSYGATWLYTHHQNQENTTVHLLQPLPKVLLGRISSFQNVTVRHRLERAVRTLQRAWRGRRLSRVIRGRGLPDGVCDLIAWFAVRLPSPV